MLTADPSRCLLVYPRRRVGADPGAADGAVVVQRQDPRACSGCSSATPTTSRSTRAGRILVPPALRRYASLDKHVVLVGQGHKFELWDEAQWQAQTAQAIAFPADGLPPELDGFSL